MVVFHQAIWTNKRSRQIGFHWFPQDSGVKLYLKNSWNHHLQDGRKPLVISRVITSMSRLLTPVTHLFSPICRCFFLSVGFPLVQDPSANLKGWRSCPLLLNITWRSWNTVVPCSLTLEVDFDYLAILRLWPFGDGENVNPFRGWLSDLHDRESKSHGFNHLVVIEWFGPAKTIIVLVRDLLSTLPGELGFLD